ncbi:keratin-associated protein 4-4-like [Biomphalaria glabrata]|uniref:Keratin-associated protein 4-4-like n=1 Tax=Biomphalaria glabrata TaxID=6526 RepID=A0A9W2Z2Q7_BIOGL|nr:keratin-associated protein 4-4-like [Biomphalaria glabrata]
MLTKQSLRLTVIACLHLMTPWTAGQANTGGLVIYSSPLYCLTIVSTYQTCPPTYCYTSSTRSQCCMGLYKTITGSLYQQCKCTSAVGCTPLSGSQTAVAPTSSFFYDTPLYCSSTPSTNLCATSDACFNSATRSSCCISVQRIPQTISGMPDTFTTCSCNAGVQCPAPAIQNGR